jgi:hypothetical protein
MTDFSPRTPHESTQKTVVLLTPRALFVIVSLTLFYCCVFYFVFHWSPEGLCMYILYITYSVGVVYVAQFSPFAQHHLTIMAEDVKTMQSHWEHDWDLRYTTYVTRTLYVLSILSWIAGIILVFNVPEDVMVLVMSGCMPDVEKWFWNSPFAYAWMMSSALFILSAIIEWIGNLHIIFFRNNPVRSALTALCKVCYEVSGKVVIGASAGGTIAYQLLAVIPGVEITPALQVLQKYGPFNAGYTFELGSSLPSMRNRLLLHVPGYNPWDLVDPETSVLDTRLQDKWIQDNIGQVRTHCSTTSLQAMQIDPKPFSRY